MNKPTEVVQHQPSLPGIVPAADEATELLRAFTVWEEGRDYVTTRTPTSVERELLQRRLLVLDHALKSFTKAPSDQEGVKRALAAFFAGYPSLQNADAKGLIAAYMTDLQSLPRFAVERALDEIKHGRVSVPDGRGGHAKMDPDWPPTSPRVYDVAVKAMHERAMEQVKIQKLMRAKAAMPEDDLTPEQRAEAVARVQSMSQQAKNSLQVNAQAALATDAAERERRAKADNQQRTERWEEGCLAEYKRLRVAPLYVGDVLISPMLAKKVRPELFAAGGD